MSNERPPGLLSRIAKAAAKVESNELGATSLSFLFVFLSMAAYFLLRPARDSMAGDWTQEEVSWLWTATFFFSVLAVILYGGIISRVRFSRVVPGVYLFFALTFVAFWAGARLLPDPETSNQVFYVWLSVFSLFHLSVFWSFMSGVFNREQAPRLFAPIATGASLGAMVGPTLPTFFGDDIGTLNLLLVSAGLLLLTIPIILRLQTLKETALGNPDLAADLTDAKRLGRNPFSGFMLFVKNPYLLAIGVFILFYVTMSTFIYMELRNELGEFDRDTRTQIYGAMDLIVNSLTFVVGFFVTGRLATRFGMAATLALIPALMVGGWLIVAAVPLLAVLAGLQISRRIGNYSVTRPGREMLFTVVDEETRYKAKPVIDIVLYRGGDMVTAWLYAALTATLGLGLAGVATLAAGIAAVWAFVGIYLGRAYRDHDNASASSEKR